MKVPITQEFCQFRPCKSIFIGDDKFHPFREKRRMHLTHMILILTPRTTWMEGKRNRGEMNLQMIPEQTKDCMEQFLWASSPFHGDRELSNNPAMFMWSILIKPSCTCLRSSVDISSFCWLVHSAPTYLESFWILLSAKYCHCWRDLWLLNYWCLLIYF